MRRYRIYLLVPLCISNLQPKLVQIVFLGPLLGNQSPMLKYCILLFPYSPHLLKGVDHACGMLPTVIPIIDNMLY